MRIRVIKDQDCPTRYFVESSSLECVKCRHVVSRSKATAADPCAKCGGKLDVIFRHVDMADLQPVGKCDCPDFDYHKRSKLERMRERERRGLCFEEQDRWRCQHIRAARNFALNETVAAHEAERLRDAKGRREDQT